MQRLWKHTSEKQKEAQKQTPVVDATLPKREEGKKTPFVASKGNTRTHYSSSTTVTISGDPSTEAMQKEMAALGGSSGSGRRYSAQNEHATKEGNKTAEPFAPKVTTYDGFRTPGLRFLEHFTSSEFRFSGSFGNRRFIQPTALSAFVRDSESLLRNAQDQMNQMDHMIQRQLDIFGSHLDATGGMKSAAHEKQQEASDEEQSDTTDEELPPPYSRSLRYLLSILDDRPLTLALETAITENKIMIFSKTTCGYCKKAKALFAAKYPGETPVVFELNQREDGADIQAYLADKTGQRTVPNIFVNKQHVGGNDDTQAAFKSGKLTELIDAA
ncbi:hypothetical protein C8R46DRAFT_1032754 [Mycena filopes]|nr:hypothetical protein C8R46DRAFT_1032754 [Mycena filopes]